MRILLRAFTLAMTTPAAAQRRGDLPQTIKLYDNRSGTVLGTGTVWGNRMTMRDLEGKLVGTVVFDKDGKKTFYDPDGNITDALSISPPLPKLPEQ